MQNIHFTIRPYRDSFNKVNSEFIYLCLVTDNSTVVVRECIRTSAWRNDENKCQEYWKHHILSQVKNELLKSSKTHGGYIYNREKRLVIDDAIYDEWYRWYYYIDGEDAHEFISYCGHSQHTTNWQSRCGVVVGWKFYKELRKHDFNKSTAAMLAYTRGYLAGMESNSPWDHEGLEALHCLGLDIEGGSDALRAF